MTFERADDERANDQPAGPPPLDSAWRRVRHYGAMVRDPLSAVQSRFDRYGDVYRVLGGRDPLYVLRHPDHIRDVLLTQGAAFGKGHSAFAQLRGVLGDGLLTSEGEVWRRQRRLVQPAFARPRLAEYAEMMVEEARVTTDALASRAPGDVLQLNGELTALTLRIVARTLFGQRVDDSPRVGRAMTWLNSAFGRPSVLPARLPTPGRSRLRRAVAELDAAVYDVIDRRSRTPGSPQQSDLLQRLLDARDDEGDGSGMSRKELRDQVLTLYVAGHETTSQALSWTFYLLSQNEHARVRLQRELDDVLGGRPPRFEDLQALPYTEWVFKEAMRIYPPVCAIPRRALHDTTMGPYAVPAGSEAVIWVYHAHHDPRFFPDPKRFVPERFDEAQSTARPRHAYLPFGAGQRACIGQSFAMVEAQLIIATFAQRLDLRYAAKRPPGLRLGVTLAPDNGLPMRVFARA